MWKSRIVQRWMLMIVAVSFLLAAACTKRDQTASSTSQQATFRVACLIPLTGPGASLGEYLRNGIEMAKEEATAQYGSNLRLEVEYLDSQNQPQEGLNALRTALMQQRPDALICGLSSVSKAVAPVAEDEKLLTIVTTTALTGLPQGTQYVVRLYPTSEDFVAPVAGAMADAYDRIGVLYVNDDFGNSNQKLFRQMVESRGKQIVAAEPFELTQSDARSLLARVLSRNPDAVFVTGYGPAFTNVFKQLREQSASLPIYTEVGFANPAVLSALGPVAEGITFDVTPVELSEPTLASAADFRTKYQARFQAEPFMVAGFAHDSLMLLCQAAMKDGYFVAPTKEAVLACAPVHGVMGEITLDSEGESRIAMQLARRTQGRTVLLAPAPGRQAQP